MILAGDVGGTKVHLALYDFANGKLSHTRDEKFPARQYDGLEVIVREFLGADRVTAACFGVPGPVRDGRLRLTNLPWTLDNRELAANLAIQHVFLINDLEANAHGLSELRNGDFAVLAQGVRNGVGNAAIISAGTGLGVAGLYWDGITHHPFAAEGGHADFAPANDLQAELWQYLHKKFGGHVSWERVLSGPGQFNLYQFLRDTGKGQEEPWLAKELREGDPSAIVSKHGLTGESPLCEQAVDLFVELYGAAAGNLALNFLAVGGVFIGGGIAPKILPKLKDRRFMQAFLNKGRLRTLLEQISVRVVLNDKTALLGAGHVAMMNAVKAKSTIG